METVGFFHVFFFLLQISEGIEGLCNLPFQRPTNADLHLGGLHRGNRRYWNCSHLRSVSGDETARTETKMARYTNINVYIYICCR